MLAVVYLTGDMHLFVPVTTQLERSHTLYCCKRLFTKIVIENGRITLFETETILEAFARGTCVPAGACPMCGFLNTEQAEVGRFRFSFSQNTDTPE